MRTLGIARRLVLGVAAVALGVCGLARGATFNVAAGDAAGLVTAMTTAQANADAANTIDLAGGTYTLTAVAEANAQGDNGLPIVSGKTLTINGNGSVIARDATAPAFRILMANNVGGTTLNLNNVSLLNGAPSGAFWGGGVFTPDGGGVTVNMTDCRVANCTAGGLGGGVGVVRTDLTMVRCTVENCTSAAGGGGVAYLMQGNVLNLTDCTLRNNTVTGNDGQGGGLWLAHNGWLNTITFTLMRCTISGNSVTGGGACYGGGVYFAYGIGQTWPYTPDSRRVMNFDNCTISGNSVTNGSGGGVCNLSAHGYGSPPTYADMNLTSCTVTGNSASVSGGGVLNMSQNQPAYTGSNATMRLRNTIVAGNTAPTGPDGYNWQVSGVATLISLGYNLIGNNADIAGQFPAGNPNGNNDRVNVAANLGPLQDNGGLTLTHAPLGTSAAIENGDPALAGGADQRSRTRAAPVVIGAVQTPTITGEQVDQSISDNDTVQPFSTLTVNAPFNTGMDVAVTITNGVNRGDFTAASSAGWTRTVVGNDIQYTQTFPTAADIGAAVTPAIQGFVFQPRQNGVAPTQSETTDFVVSVNDGSGAVLSGPISVITTNDLPTLTNVAVTPTAVDEGGTVTVSGDITLAGAHTYVVTIDWGEGAPQTYNYSGTDMVSISETHQYLDDNPTATRSDRYTISVRVETDGQALPAGTPQGVMNGDFATGDFSSWTIIANGSNNGESETVVINAPNYAQLTAADTDVAAGDTEYTRTLRSNVFAVPAGTDISFGAYVIYGNDWPYARAQLFDANTNAVVYTFFDDVYDGDYDLSSSYTTVANGSFYLEFQGGSWDQSEGGSVGADLQIWDVRPAVPALPVATLTTTVRNVAAQLQNVTVTPAVNEGGTATISGTIVDPGVQDTFTLHVDWGDGTIEDLAYPAGTTNFTATHVYADDNPSGTAQDTYNVTVQLQDDDAAATQSVDIDGLLANLDADNSLAGNAAPGDPIVRWVPGAYPFTDGNTGTNIGDGGSDMYDGGNYLNTDLGTSIAYSDGLVTASDGQFGAGSQYFTVKYEGVFAMVATGASIDTFELTGNNGADGSGNVDAAQLSTTVNGQQYTIFVKRVYNAGDPSINQIVIVPGDGTGISQTFSGNTDDTLHTVTGLSSVSEVYYVLVASGGGGYIADADITNIANAFLVDIPTGANPDINTILTNLNARNAGAAIVFPGIGGQVPDVYNFGMDGGNSYISDGGDDMYDDGNYLSTDLAGTVLYTDGVVTASDAEFGSGSRYFTAKYPGGFVLAAVDISINTFEINGDNGADGGGSVDGTVLSTTVDGKQYTIFVKRVYDAGDPSINQIVIVPGDGAGITQDFSTDTNNSYHSVTGLSSVTELYYVLVAKDPNVNNGEPLADADVINVANAVLGCIPPPVINSYAVTVNNVAPAVASLGAPVGVVTGTVVTLAPDVTDAGGAGDPLTYAWTITKPDGAVLTFSVPGPIFNADLTGAYTIALTVSDDDLGVTTVSGTMTADIAVAVASGPTATPNPSPEQGPVEFTCTANTANVTYTWDFTDGTTATGATVTHTFMIPGTYNVTVTITSTINGTSASATVEVKVYDIPNGMFDTDNDNFSDEIELALGSDPNNGASTPFSLAPPVDASSPAVTRLRIGLNFAAPGNDSIRLLTWLGLAQGFSPSGQRIIINVGGVVKSFVLDAKGGAKEGNDIVKLSARGRASTKKCTISFRKGTFAAAFADEGLANASIAKAARPVLVTVIVGGQKFEVLVPQAYTAISGKGTTK